MTTPTGAISLLDVIEELDGVRTPRAISLNDADVRELAGIPSGPISLNDLRGKSSFSWTGFPTGSYPYTNELTFYTSSGGTAAADAILTITSTGDKVTFTGIADQNLYNSGSDKTIYYKVVSASGFTSNPAITGTWTSLSSLQFRCYTTIFSNNGNKSSTKTGTAQIQLATDASGSNAQTLNFTVTATARIIDGYH